MYMFSNIGPLSAAVLIALLLASEFMISTRWYTPRRRIALLLTSIPFLALFMMDLISLTLAR